LAFLHPENFYEVSRVFRGTQLTESSIFLNIVEEGMFDRIDDDGNGGVTNLT
jgi:hypothetical protein